MYHSWIVAPGYGRALSDSGRPEEAENLRATLEDLVDVGEVRQGEAATGHAAGVEAEQPDPEAHRCNEARPDDLGPARNRSLRS